MPVRKYPLPALPRSAWPASLRHSWDRAFAPDEQRHSSCRSSARALGRYLATVMESSTSFVWPPDLSQIDTYRAELAKYLSPSSLRTELPLLGRALMAVHPETDWTWLCRTKSSPSTDRRRNCRPTTQPTDRRRRLLFTEWPLEQQRTWQERARKLRLPSISCASNPDHAGNGYTSLRGREATEATLVRGWGRFLFWQQQAYCFGDSPTPDSLLKYAEWETANGSSEISLATYISEIYRATRRLWPTDDWTWLKSDMNDTKAIARPSRNKYESLAPIGKICRVGLDLMSQAESMLRTQRAAVRHRDGLLIALLGFRPKRISNIRELRLGTSLILDEHGHPVRLRFDRTKNGDPSGVDFPALLVDHAVKHLTVYRPILLAGGQPTSELWISRHGTPLRAGSFWRIVSMRMEPALVRRIGPHMIRTAFATSVAQERSELLPAVGKMLDHRDARSIEPYQLHAQSIGASRRLDESLSMLRVLPTRARNHRRGSPATA